MLGQGGSLSFMTHHLAQINIARCKAPLDSPTMRGFFEQLDAINALADATPGFVWRLQSDAGDATSIRAYEDPLTIVNMSVWTGIEPLKTYAYRSAHAEVFRKRKEWFEELPGPILTLWWIPAGSIPTPEEGKRRLEILEQRGPTVEAFTFRATFPPAP